LAILALVIPEATSPSTSTSLEVSPAGCSEVEEGGRCGGFLFREGVLYCLLKPIALPCSNASSHAVSPSSERVLAR
jgi:hypothetical protein